MNGVICTTADCPCGEFRDLGPPVKSLMADQRGADSIVFPLVAGTLAHCVLVSARRHAVTLTGTRVASLVDHARLILKLADAADAPQSWERNHDAFATVSSFVLAGWDVLLEWVPEYYVPVVADWVKPTTTALIEAAKGWVDRKQARSLTELVLFSAEVANRLVETERVSLPILAKPLRPVRAELAARLRASNLDTWPQVLRASANDWRVEALEKVLFDYAAAGNLSADLDTTLQEEMAGQDDESPHMDDDHTLPVDPDAVVRERQPLGAIVDALLTDAIARLDRSEARSRAIEAKRLELADRYAVLQGRVERLTNEMASARHEITGLRSELAAVKRDRAD